MDYAKKAEELFLSGYNCAQSVFGAFAEDLNMPVDVALKLSAPFGGGMGRMREVCGACSGMFMAAGLLYGYSTPETGDIKAEHYALIRQLAEQFRKENGSIICRDILGEGVQVGGTPEKRTETYYKARPCVLCVKSAAEILQAFMQEKN